MFKKYFTNIILVIVSVLTVVVISELLLRLIYSNKIDYNIEMWRYGQKVSVPVDDLRGHFQRPGVDTQLMGSRVKTNSNGFREKEIDSKKSENKFRIAVVGDSFTFGWGVEDSERFSNLLQEKLKDFTFKSKKIELLNFGIVNYNTVQQLALVKENIKKFNPDLYLLCFYVNDAEPTQKFSHNFISGNSYLVAFLLGRLRRIGSYYANGKTFEHLYFDQFKGENWKLYQQTLLDFLKVVETKIAVVLLPELRQPHEGLLQEIYIKNKVFWKEHGVPVLDLNAKIPGAGRATLWVSLDDPHPNKKGHMLFSEYIDSFLRKKVMVDK